MLFCNGFLEEMLPGIDIGAAKRRLHGAVPPKFPIGLCRLLTMTPKDV